jgi:hypothetical protein
VVFEEPRTLRWTLALTALATLCACPGGDSNNDGGTNGDGGSLPEPDITVSGTASVFPPAAGWMADGGLTSPSLGGRPFLVEDPLKAGLADPDATLATGSMGGSGEFSASAVSTSKVNAGIALAFRDVSAVALVRTTSLLWDVTFAQRKPRVNLSGMKAFALPQAFHDALTSAIGGSTIQGLTQQEHATLSGAGFYLGQVLNVAGQPVPGVTVVPTPASLSSQLFYPSESLSGPNPSSTSASGLFVFVHSGGAAQHFTFTLSPDDEYGTRGGALVPGVGQLSTLQPGSAAEPYPSPKSSP